MLAGAAVGGGTLVNWMTSIAVPDDVRAEWAAEHGLDGVDGGDGAELDADLESVMADVGASPSMVIPPKDEVILRGATALGWEAAPIVRNARDCGDCGSCPFGCPRGTNQSGIRVHLASAVERGARVIPRATVRRVLVEGGRAVGVEADVGVSGDLAWQGDTYKVIDKSGATVDTGKTLTVFQRRDAKWMIIRDTWNSEKVQRVFRSFR